jgi:hypothetical protein
MITMLRRLFSDRSYGFVEGRCIPAWYETLWMWDRLRKLAALLKRVFLACTKGLRRRRQISVGDYTKLKLPIIRRAYPAIVAEQLCSVQPMTSPVSMALHVRHIKEEFGKKKFFDKQELFKRTEDL